ncbi:alginate export family protein [Gemmatimonas phototrophica]|uniref:alginate export family protein n=1 Tax=Gemmatimonas phototrophica TaxID=1379270 RepID=UPI0011AE8861|nr:alginate export family protein [Gemmatimonas phototrophica]
MRRCVGTWKVRLRRLLPLFLVVPTGLLAQSATGAPAPAHDLFAPLKNIALAGDRPLVLTVGGQLRWREEFFRGFNTLPLADDHAQTRVLLTTELVAGRRTGAFARLYAEGRDAQSYGRNLPGGVRSNDADRADFQTAYIDAGYRSSLLRVGRQEIGLARERMFGAPDWSNTRRSSTGARLQLVHKAFALEAVDARPIIVRLRKPNVADSTQRFRTLSIGSSAGARPLARGLPSLWQSYWYEQSVRPASGLANRAYRLTSGGRVQWQWRTAKTHAVSHSLEFEGARQFGTVGTRDIQAGFWVAEAQWQFKRVLGAPTLALGVEEASSERPGTSNTLEVFSVMYPAAHQHGGYADVIGRPNVRELHAISQWNPHPALDLRGALYWFDRLRLDDGVYTKQNTLFRAAGTSRARHVAEEIDVTGTWRATTHLRVIFGGALVLPGAFLRETLADTQTERWGFVGTTFVF